MTHHLLDFFNRDRPSIDPDPTKWPWKAAFKSYPRRPKIKLPPPAPLSIPLDETIRLRKTDRIFLPEALNIDEISLLLFYSCGVVSSDKEGWKSHRAYPSGGGLYPIEIYPLVIRGPDHIGAGIYHYSIKEHSLEKLGDFNSLDEAFTTNPWAKEAALILIFSLIDGRTKPKYGNFAYKLALIETGHISQNIYLNCAALSLKCCALGGIEEEKVNSALDLDGETETTFYAVAVGK